MYNLVSLLVPEFHYIAEFASEKNWKTQAKDDILIRLNVQLAGRNRFDIEWTLISNQSALQRHLKCDWPLLKVLYIFGLFNLFANQNSNTLQLYLQAFRR